MKANIGRYKDRDHYLGVSLGIVDDLTSPCPGNLISFSVQELRDKKEKINLFRMTDFLLKDYDFISQREGNFSCESTD